MWIKNVLLLTTAVWLCKGDLDENSWWWPYSCENEQCVRSAEPIVNATPVFDNLLNVCRLQCEINSLLWPKPYYSHFERNGMNLVLIHPDNIHFNFLEKVIYLDSVAEIFKTNLILECLGNCTIYSDIEVRVDIKTESTNMILNWNTDETYSISIKTRLEISSKIKTNEPQKLIIVKISAATVYGARHALETLIQLIKGYEINGSHGLVMVGDMVIMDKPIYSHRGLLLDTSRNFLTLEAIQRTIDGMAASKLNVLHWHATDSHSFPLDLPRSPLITRFGAYSSKEIYRPQDIAKLIDYARLRGVQIILELDGPAHAGNGWQWGPEEGLGELAVCVNQQPWRMFCIQPPCGQLNPSNPNLYKTMKNVFLDLNEMFPDMALSTFHMGGDEVFFPCWNSSSEIIKWMESRGMNRTVDDFLDVWAEHQNKLLNLWDDVTGKNTTPILLWSSHLTDINKIEDYLSKTRYVIETWVEKDDELPLELLSKGYRVIYATKDAWYLDHGFWGSTMYHNWKIVYDNTLPNKELGVLGGEVAMWGEYVDDHNLDSRVWPRASALGERLWSNPNTSSSSASNRIQIHRDILLRRGINAEQLEPEWCQLNENQCL